MSDNSHKNDDFFRQPHSFDEDDPYERGFADKLYEYDDAPQQQPMPPRRRPSTPQAYYTPGKKKRRRSAGKTILSVLLIFLLLVGILAAVVWFSAKQPTADNTRARRDGCSTILIAGTDESGNLTDTLMLVNFNRTDKKISIMSIPRDTRVNSSYSPHKINGAYGMNGGGKAGMDALMGYVADSIGFYPDGYILIELDVFIDLVDLFGGVEFDVPMNMNYDDDSQDLHIHLEEGMQRLNGEQSMGLVRFRSGYTMADLQRVNVQRDFLMAALQQWTSLWNFYKVPKALSLLGDNSLTDLSTRNMIWLAESVLLCGTDDMNMQTVPYYLSDGSSEVYITGDEAYLDLINEYFNPYEREIGFDDLNLGR